jgi:ketosteroid isomerase-like protein
MDVEALNAAWLEAWSNKDTATLLTQYHPDVTYKDAQTAAGISGEAALRAYLEGLFAATPPMRYTPDRVWPIEDGFCGRWFAEMDLPDGSKRRMRGFDLCLLREGRIVYNEVYTHQL